MKQKFDTDETASNKRIKLETKSTNDELSVKTKGKPTDSASAENTETNHSDTESLSSSDEEQDKNKVTTLSRYLKKCKKNEKLASSILKYKSDACTYSEGYATQKIYSCITCFETSGHFLGVCYSCSIDCHTSHKLEELDSRLGFRCDCPTQTCPVNCSFAETKAEKNTENTYNDNFKGVYCSCKRPYDREAQTQTMFLCQMCQDWFHEKCIGQVPNQDTPPIKNCFVCAQCTKQVPRLIRYAVAYPELFVALPCNVTIPKINGGANSPIIVDKDVTCPLQSEEALLIESQLGDQKTHLFFNEGLEWCTCDQCSAYFTEHKILYFIKPFPTISYQVDDSEPVDPNKLLLNALGKMDRVKAIDAVNGYVSLKNSLQKFLLAHQDKVITVKDIESFSKDLFKRG